MSYTPSQSSYSYSSPSQLPPQSSIPPSSFSPSIYDSNSPPPPPPKPTAVSPPPRHPQQTFSPISQNSQGPPLPPIPPYAHQQPQVYPPSEAPPQQQQQQQQHPGGPPPPSNGYPGAAPPPQPSQTQPSQPGSHAQDNFLPAILKDKAKPDLSYALHSAPLLDALTHTHPTYLATLPSLHASLNTNITTAQSLLALEAQLKTLRDNVSTRLLAVRALEARWREQQAAMDRALEPFGAKGLYQVLGMKVAEQEEIGRALEESFLEGEGLASEREVAEFVRRFREARKLGVLRRERKRRWDEGRVGGWR